MSVAVGVAFTDGIPEGYRVAQQVGCGEFAPSVFAAIAHQLLPPMVPPGMRVSDEHLKRTTASVPADIASGLVTV